jgi:hypothetical protein
MKIGSGKTGVESGPTERLAGMNLWLLPVHSAYLSPVCRCELKFIWELFVLGVGHP